MPLEGGFPGAFAVFAFPEGIPPHVHWALRQGIEGFPMRAPLALQPRALAAAS
jgi:hypothetical protein